MRDSPLPNRPYLKPWYRIATVPGGLALEYGQMAVLLEGAAVERLLPALLPLLDGTRTLAEVEAHLGEPVAPAVRHAIGILAAHGLLTEGPPVDGDAARAASFVSATSHRGTSPARARRALRRGRVVVAGEGRLAADVARLLRAAGVVRLARTGPAELVVAVPHAPHELEEVNERALETGTPWLQVLAFDGRFAAVGPLYLPGETCCFGCFQLRRAANAGYPDEFWRLEEEPPPERSFAAVDAVVAGLAAWLAVRRIADDDPFLAGRFYALEVAEELLLRAHHVYRVPRCPICSPARRTGAPLPWADAA